MATYEFVAELTEAEVVAEIFATGLTAIADAEAGIVRIYGWTDMPASFTPEDDQEIERFLVLRAIIPIDAFRDFLARGEQVIGAR